MNLKKRRGREVSVDETETPSLFGESRADEYGLVTDTARRVLTEDEFSVLTLAAVCGYKRREIGEMLDLPTSMVTWKYNNAVAKMRKALEDE